MALFARVKEPFLRSFLKLENGPPSHDTFSRLFRSLDPGQFCASFQRFMERFSSSETAYYLLSQAFSPEPWNTVVRSHWQIENRLHGRLDVVMSEDQDRTPIGHGPVNIAVLRHMALNTMQKEGSKGSLRGKFKQAGWDDHFLIKLLTMF